MALQDMFRERSMRTILDGLASAQLRDHRPRLVFFCSALTLIVSLLLGGGTRGGFLSDAVLELLAIPALLISFVSLVELPHAGASVARRKHLLLGACFAILLLPLVQLVPLPPWIWTRLPGRDEVVAVYDLLGHRRPWMPLSVSPNATWLSFLSLLPPIAIVLGVVQLSYQERRALTVAFIAFGVASVFLGLAQLAQGPSSSLRFFTVTNATDAVGFFANRNHFAALLYTVLLFAAAWAIDLGYKTRSLRDLGTLELSTGRALGAIVVVVICLLAAEAVVRSRAGLILTIGALTGAFALGFVDRRQATAAGARSGRIMLVALIVAVILVIQFALYQVLSRYALDSLQDARISFARNTFQAAKAFMPFGSGLGTFVPVYGMFEKPSDVLLNTFANHAHDDFLELLQETGLMGMALVGGVLVWLGFSAAKIWWKPPAHASHLDYSLSRAATLVIGLLIAHSFVDYPLRTGAMMAVFAFSCALLIEPWAGAEATMRVEAEPKRDRISRKAAEHAARTAVSLRTSPGSSAPPAQETKVSPQPLRQPAELWGDEIDWPEEWRKSGEHKPSEHKSSEHKSSEQRRSGEDFDQSKPKK